MLTRLPIRWLLATALLGVGGCATPKPPEPAPLSQDEVDQFLAGGRDARAYGITIYPSAAGTRFEFANRPRPERTARLDFAGPRFSRMPIVKGRSAVTDPFPLLLDTSARQSWATLAAAKGLEYRVFAPAEGEYADHVAATIPGYAGVGNKLIFDKLHVESPVYYVAPAGGGLGAFARAAERPDLDPPTAARRAKTAGRLPLVLGSATLRNFAFVRFDFPGRAVVLSSTRAYQPANASAVAANLPMLDWRGRPAVQAALAGEPLLLVIDTAGDFDLVLSGEQAEGAMAELALGARAVGDVEIAAAAAFGLPEEFPARLGLGVLADYAVTLDFKNRRVWFEDPRRTEADAPASAAAVEISEPIQYRGVRP
ncbi:MAG: hypothetical protein AB7V22_03470 [Kiritimatiellia bacterium]